MRKFVVMTVVCLVIAALSLPMQSVKAGGEKGSAHWGPQRDTVPNPGVGGGWLVQAVHYNDHGEIDSTITTGHVKSKRKAKKAAKELAESLNAGGSSFKWEPGCEGLLC
jgi:hypothetical protein